MYSFVHQIAIALGATSLLLGVLGYTMSAARPHRKPHRRPTR